MFNKWNDYILSKTKYINMNTSRLNTLLSFLEEDPTDAFTRFAIAQEYMKMGNWDQAKTAYESLMQDQPRYVGTYYHLGKLYEKKHLWQEATEIYKKGIKIAEEENSLHDKAELQSALLAIEYGDIDEDD